MEKVEIEHPFHEHPLILSENVVDKDERVNCYGCNNPVSNREWAYVCIKEKYCSSKTVFHRSCGELSRQISLLEHPEHPLHLVDFRQLRWHYCNLCYHILGSELGYRCSICDFDLDIKCKRQELLLGMEASQLHHPAHFHPLVLMRKPPFVFSCDACGTEDEEHRDMAYTCKSATCNLLIHKSCASLPALLQTNRHHHHLSLSSPFPFHHRKFVWQCAVCGGDFDLSCWVYCCGDCRYFAHLKCATSTEEDSSNLNNEDGFDLIQFPLLVRDVSEKLITSFVIQETGVDKIPDVNDMPQSISMPKTTASSSLSFHYHKHILSLVSELVSHDDDGNEDEDDEVKMKICDVCVAPIFSPPYYECSTCNYLVHYVCYMLPNTLSASESQLCYSECPKSNNRIHKFTHYTNSKRLMDKGYSHLECEVCGSYTNGMVYKCDECGVMIDAKCASLPICIKHECHHRPHHALIKWRVQGSRIKCFCCKRYCKNIAYRCTGDVAVFCDFALCPDCVLLPKDIIKKEWDKHPLVLTYDAFINHPSDFYCGICEQEMHPKEWMYHCRPCDNSFHIYCLRSAFEWYRHIKLGRQFEFAGGLHPHPLTFKRITLKSKCNVCDSDEYLDEGFKCASCVDNFVVCRRCGYFELEKKYRNIKFGLQFEFDHRLHPHPLTFNQITIKLRCDVCHEDKHLYEGFECAPCNYVVCISCGRQELNNE